MNSTGLVKNQKGTFFLNENNQWCFETKEDGIILMDVESRAEGLERLKQDGWNYQWTHADGITHYLIRNEEKEESTSSPLDKHYFPHMVKSIVEFEEKPETLKNFLLNQKDFQIENLLQASRWLNQLASEELKRRSQKQVYCYCDDCDFEHFAVDFKQLQHDLTEMDGAMVGDGEGGCCSICPKCKEDKLVITD